MAITLNGTSGPTFDAGQRITGDFSNATFANRVSFQTSTSNNSTIIQALPNGTSKQGAFWAFDNSTDQANAAIAAFGLNFAGTQVAIQAAVVGTGTYLPITFYTNGSEQMRIATDGTITSTLGGMQVRSGTAVTASGTSVDFTSIPSWVKRITVMFSGVSTNGGSLLLIQLGDSGGIENSSYVSGAFDNSTSNNSSAGFLITSQNINTANWCGAIVLTQLSGNLWNSSGSISTNVGGYLASSGGAKTLSATLDRIRITTVNGTDTFDAGSINILYE